MLTSIIVDNEEHCAESLHLTLQNYCPAVKVLSVVSSSLLAEAEIRKHKPDILFLDIEMPHLDGFEVLNKVQDLSFEVIFTTAFDHYALKAIKHHAFDYLLKPIDPDELLAAVEKIEAQKSNGISNLVKIGHFLLELEHEKKGTKLSVHSSTGIVFIEIEEIVHITADSNYSHIYLLNGKKLTSTRTLKEHEKILPASKFFRTHNTHIVNLRYVERFVKGEGGIVVMSNGAEIEVSRQKKKALLDILG